MPRLIDADALSSILEEWEEKACDGTENDGSDGTTRVLHPVPTTTREMIDLIANQPTMEPKLPKYGTPLTLEELRQMHGQPVWIGQESAWGIVNIDYEGKPFVTFYYKKVRCEYDIESRGLACYSYVPVRRGRWVDRYNGEYANPLCECSECKGKAAFRPELDDNYNWWHTQDLSAYCPNCGAKMDGERVESE